MIIAGAVLCLAMNIYREARGESIPGQYAVALVTMNRAEQDRRKVCHQVFRHRQFSWTNHGVKKVKKGWKVPGPQDPVAWSLSLKIAKHTLKGRMPDFTWGSTHYHSIAVSPDWGLLRIKQIGNHIFYS
jgi:N-acetylmuramoyl-L-alanine amidase